MPYRTLNHWRFDDPNWPGYLSQAPLLFFNVEGVESWSGYAVSFGGIEPAWLAFPMVDDAGQPNLDPSAGAVQFWFSPYWSSEAAGGKGPGQLAVLFVAGSWSQQSAVGWWSLEVDPDGDSVALVAVGPVDSVEVLRAPLAWQAGAWHQLTLNYSAKGTELYLDGALAAAGPGVELTPLSPSPGRDGFGLGSAALGDHSALGEFDELSTFIEPRRAADIAAHYHMMEGQAALGPISPEEEAQFRAKIQSLAAAGFGAMAQGQAMSFNCGNGPALQATLLADNSVRLDFFCREAGVTYELAYAPSLTEPIHWQRVAFIPPEQVDYVVSDASVPQESPAYSRSGFYRFGKLPDYYVWAGAGPNGDGSRDLPYRTIQEALNQAPDGTAINVLPGVYTGTGNYNLSFGNKNLVLVSERGWEQTTIDCGEVAGRRAFTFDTAIAAKVIGFTIANARDSAVVCSGASRPIFINCAFTGNSATQGGAVRANDATVALINCRFWNNSASSLGGAIYAQLTQQVPHYWVYISHCTFSDNWRPADKGTIHAADDSSVEIDNSILWTALDPDPGVEIVATVTSGGTGTVLAKYCDIRGVVYPGEGNLNMDPLFETGNNTLRLTSASPCIDRGKASALLGESWATRYDMDGEARLDHAGFTNPYSTTDIGADEFVYRLQFDLDSNSFSEVDEASGVAYLGSVQVGAEFHPKFAVVADEVTKLLYIYELDATGSQIVGRTPSTSAIHPRQAQVACPTKTSPIWRTSPSTPIRPGGTSTSPPR